MNSHQGGNSMELLKQENVQICDKETSWEEAIRISVEPLEKGGYVTPEYKEQIIANVKELGPYIVLTPDIALPHARPEQGVLESQLAVTLFRNPVAFNEDYPSTRLFIALAAKDGEKHLSALASITELFQDDEKIQSILSSEDEESLCRYFIKDLK